MNESKQQEMPLESGTDELEIMVFTIGSQLFGINVDKVLEIMKVEPLESVQKANKYIEGIFKPRDKVITVINLPTFLGLAASEKSERDILIIAGINNSEYAFHVHTVVGIDRISYTHMKKTDPVIYGGKEGMVTGIVEFGKKLITIISFEAVIAMICLEEGLEVAEISERVNS